MSIIDLRKRAKIVADKIEGEAPALCFFTKKAVHWRLFEKISLLNAEIQGDGVDRLAVLVIGITVAHDERVLSFGLYRMRIIQCCYGESKKRSRRKLWQKQKQYKLTAGSFRNSSDYKRRTRFVMSTHFEQPRMVY